MRERTGGAFGREQLGLLPDRVATTGEATAARPGNSFIFFQTIDRNDAGTAQSMRQGFGFHNLEWLGLGCQPVFPTRGGKDREEVGAGRSVTALFMSGTIPLSGDIRRPGEPSSN